MAGGEDKMKKIFTIKGMHCESCSKLIESELEDNGIFSKIDFKSGKAVINFDEKKISEDRIKSLIKNLSYNLE